MIHKFIFLTSSIVASLITLLSFTKINAELQTKSLDHKINSDKIEVFKQNHNNLYGNSNAKSLDKTTYNYSSSCTDQINIPDVNFKNKLLELGVDTNNDGVICRNEAEAFTDALFLIGLNISDLTGIEAFTNITELYCSHNQLTSLDVSNNLLLQKLSCNNNKIKNIDISKNTALYRLACDKNELTSLNVANGNNANMTAMRAHKNPSLSCIQHDENFDPSTSSTWLKDNTANWNTNCTIIGPPAGSKVITVTTKANATIRIDLEAIAENTAVWIETSEGNYTSVTVGTSWSDFVEYTVTGNTLKVYGNITGFDCSENESNITHLDVSNNDLLTGIWCYLNEISSLDLSQNTELKYLDCEDNIITNLNISNNKKLDYIDCGNNQLSSLDVSQNESLTRLKCYNNKISTLDVSKATKLTFLECNNNQLTSLNVANGNNINFVEFSASTNKAFDATGNTNLSCIQIDEGFTPPTTGDNKWLKDNTANWNTNCTTIGPPAGSKVITVTTKANAAIKIDLLANAANTPVWIETSEGEFTQVEVGTSWTGYVSYTVNGTTLKVHGDIKMFDCSFNYSNITGLDVSQNTGLTSLLCYSNEIKNLDLSKNTALTSVYCQNNKLESLNVANGNNSNFVEPYSTYNKAFDATGNTNLSCIQIDEGFTPPTTGDNKWLKDNTANWNTNCQFSGPPAGSKVITVTTKANAAIKIDLLANAANTPVWIETSEGEFTQVEVGTSWTGYVSYTVNGTTLKVHGDIKMFDCSFNYSNITGLDVSQNTGLTSLLCYSNEIKNLDLSKNTALTSVYCQNNKLESLNVANGNNNNFVEPYSTYNKAFDATGNTNLSCIQIDEGFTPPTTGDNKWLKDSAANWSTVPCGSVPPTGSKVITLTTKANATIKLNMFANSANTPAWVETSEGNFTKVNLGTNWSSTFGSYVVSGTTLKIHGEITGLDCNSNMSNLLGLDISQNIALKELYCVTNSLSTLDISQNKSLTKLYCDGNQLSQLKTNENTALTTLGCANNQITDLDVSKNVNLLALFVSNNNLSALNVANGNNSNMIAMEAINNPSLKCIQIDEGFTPANGWKKDSSAKWSTTPCSVSTSEIGNMENSLKIFPNPAKDYVILSGLKEGELNNIKVFNSLGKEITNLYSKEAEIKINLSSIPVGLYILSVQSKGLNNSLKFIKK